MGVVLVGLGKVGMKIYETCLSKGIDIKACVSAHNTKATHRDLSEVNLKKGDVVIDFSTPRVTLKNLPFIACKGANLILGTTGLDGDRSFIQETALENGIAIASTPNFMPDVHTFWNLVRVTSKQLSQTNQSNLRARIKEIRLSSKISPSFTARNTFNFIDRHFNSTEEKDFSVSFDGEKALDFKVELCSGKKQITLAFEAGNEEDNNKVYAEMALKTAKWVQGKKGLIILNLIQIQEIQNLKL